MRLTVAANYDRQLVPRLAEWPVAEVYGKRPADGLAGGRPSYMGTPLSWRRLGAYVAELNRYGIAFNYLLNGACLGGREWGRPWQRRLGRLMDRLTAIGVSAVTVSTPMLLERIRTRWPALRVKVGIYAQVDTPGRARFWEDLGADAITLESFSINRDFERLAAIRSAVRCELQLIANHPCLPNCALQPYHQVGMAHASDGSGGLFIDWCFLRCTRLRLADPAQLIRAAWIRPEDLGAYEALGYTTFKLTERNMPSEELLARVRAYAERTSPANLAELMLPYGFRQGVRRGRLWWARHFLRPRQLDPRRTEPFLELLRRQGMLFAVDRLGVTIDSAQLGTDFLAGFRHRPCASGDCAGCDYCPTVARRAVRVDEAWRADALERLGGLERAMASGGLWRV